MQMTMPQYTKNIWGDLQIVNMSTIVQLHWWSGNRLIYHHCSAKSIRSYNCTSYNRNHSHLTQHAQSIRKRTLHKKTKKGINGLNVFVSILGTAELFLETVWDTRPNTGVRHHFLLIPLNLTIGPFHGGVNPGTRRAPRKTTFFTRPHAQSPTQRFTQRLWPWSILSRSTERDDKDSCRNGPFPLRAGKAQPCKWSHASWDVGR